MRIDRLNELVRESNYTKTQIADLSGISRTTLDNVLAGADAKISTIESLAKVLGTSISYLFGEENDDKEIELYKNEIKRLTSLLNNSKSNRKVLIEFDVDDDDFIKLGLKEKLVQVLTK